MSQGDQWQIDGSAAELYERYAARYILGPWVPGLLDVAGVRSGDRVLDLACGTGAVAQIAVQRVGASGCVTGLDLSPGMLAVARSRQAPPGSAIAWIERSALDTGLPDRSYDVVLCQQGFQFFPDKLAALRETHRVLVPGGRLAMSVWRTAGVYNSAVGKSLGEHICMEAARRFCASRDVPGAEDLLRLVAAAGFQDAKLAVQRLIVRLPSLEHFVVGHLAGTPVAAEVRGMSDSARISLGQDVARQLANYGEGDGVAFPEEINVVTAHA
jgi:SAM-dependent methyltransferase